MNQNDQKHIDANDLEQIAKRQPDGFFLKGSGVLKLTNAIRHLEAENGALKAALSAQAKAINTGNKAAAVDEQDQRDATRYRYLRDDGDGFDLSVREEGDEGEEWVTGYPPDELDAAIDTAIAQAEKAKGGE